MARHDDLNSIEAVDRLAIRELFDAYAHCGGTRDAAGQKALFLEDCTFAVYMSGEGSEPAYVINSREGLTSVFADINQYSHTMHVNGQSTVVLDGDRATGDSYTIAHHLSGEGVGRIVMVAYLRYLDTYAKVDGAWLFAERRLILEWLETRPSLVS